MNRRKKAKICDWIIASIIIAIVFGVLPFAGIMACIDMGKPWWVGLLGGCLIDFVMWGLSKGTADNRCR